MRLRAWSREHGVTVCESNLAGQPTQVAAGKTTIDAGARPGTTPKWSPFYSAEQTLVAKYSKLLRIK